MADLAVDDKGQLKAEEEGPFAECPGCHEKKVWFRKEPPEMFCKDCQLYAKNYPVSDRAKFIEAVGQLNRVYVSTQRTTSPFRYGDRFVHGGYRYFYKTPVFLAKDGSPAWFTFSEYVGVDEWGNIGADQLLRDELRADGVKVIE